MTGSDRPSVRQNRHHLLPPPSSPPAVVDRPTPAAGRPTAVCPDPELSPPDPSPAGPGGQFPLFPARMGHGYCAVGAPPPLHGRRGWPLPSPVLLLLLALLPSPTPTATHPSLPMPTRAGHTFSSLSPSGSGVLCFPSPHCEPLTSPLLALLAWGGPHRRTR